MHLHFRPLCSAGAVTLLFALPALVACQQTDPTTSSGAATSSPVQIETVEELATELGRQAWDHESKVTPLLEGLARETNAQLYGLEHRLKSRSSTISKIRRLMAAEPALKLSEVIIGDMLRYTLLVRDSVREGESEGHYRRTLSLALQRLEAQGNQVLVVKNYWGKGDSYSGVDCELETPLGMRWELQIHTPASLRQTRINRPLYERLREPSTPLAGRQQFFDRMTQSWESVPVPAGMVGGEPLHANERHIVEERPGTDASAAGSSSSGEAATAAPTAQP